MSLIVDVRTREGDVKSPIEGSVNVSLFDLEYHIDFLKARARARRCPLLLDSGNGSRFAMEFVVKRGLKATMIPPQELDKYKTRAR